MDVDALLTAGIDSRKAEKGAKDFNKAVDSMEKKAKSAQSSMGDFDTGAMFAGAMGGAAVFAMDMAVNALAGVASGMINTMDTATNLENQLTRANGTFEQMVQVADASNTSLEATTKLYVSLDKAVSKYADSNEDVLAMTETINKAMVVSGASAQDASNALRQLAQGFYAGIIRAEEWNSIIEQGPYLLEVVSQNIEGMSGDLGKLRAMMLEGELTAKVFFEALQKGGESVDEAFAKMEKTISQAMTDLNTAWTNSVKQMNEVNDASGMLTEGIDALTEVVKFAPRVWAGFSMVLEIAQGAFTELMVKMTEFQIKYYETVKAAQDNPLTGWMVPDEYAKGMDAKIKQAQISLGAWNSVLDDTNERIADLQQKMETGIFPETKKQMDMEKYKAPVEDVGNAAANAKKEMDALNAEVAEFDRLLSQADQMRVSLMSREDRIDYDYNQVLKELEMLRREGAISAQEFEEMTDQATTRWVEQWDQALKIGMGKHREIADEMSEIWVEAYRNMERAASSFFLDAMQGNFDELGESFVKMLQKMLADWAAAQMMMGLFGPEFGKKGGALGGIIGGMFGSAATSATSAAAGPGVSSAPVVNMNITEAPGTTTETTASYSQTQGFTLDVIVQKVEAGISKNVANGRGQLAPTLQGTYGLNRAVNAYR